ncbi:thymidine kinase [Paraburkholderia sp. EG287A]|uniref:thymidine kinase n=1 Tax=Paraburkholderia sp. EG287A TaxID=3237012 RepID=UPI0034D38B54
MSKLYYRYSAMAAGKSLQLLQIHHNYTTNQQEVLLLTAQADDRFGKGRIASRLGVSAEADVFTPSTDLFAMVDAFVNRAGQDIGAILVDEAQFLTEEQVRQLHRAVHLFQVEIMCFGLRSDFQGKPFPGAAMLLTLAEDIEELKTMCACKKHKATMNMRVDANGNRVREGPQVLIGDGSYRQVCGRCFYAV